MRSDVVLDTQRYLVFAGLTVYSVYFILQLFRHDSKAFLKFWENVNQYCKVGVPFMRGYFNLPMPYQKCVPYSFLPFELSLVPYIPSFKYRFLIACPVFSLKSSSEI
jgi:hypothetical protein